MSPEEQLKRLQEALADAKHIIRGLEQALGSLRAATCAVHGVEDEVKPSRLHLVRGTPEGIRALELLLQRRFKDGYELGLAKMQDHVTQVEGALRELLQRLEVKPC